MKNNDFLTVNPLLIPETDRFFVLKDIPNREELINEFNFNDKAQVNAKEFVSAQRNLKNALYDGK